MADADFEIVLGRMFDVAPACADSQAFALRVERRLNRGWGLRRAAIGAAGVAGGLIAAGQLLGSGVLPQMEAVSERSADVFTRGVSEVMTGSWLAGFPISADVIWMAAGLGAMALALGLTRLTQEL